VRDLGKETYRIDDRGCLKTERCKKLRKISERNEGGGGGERIVQGLLQDLDPGKVRRESRGVETRNSPQAFLGVAKKKGSGQDRVQKRVSNLVSQLNGKSPGGPLEKTRKAQSANIGGINEKPRRGEPFLQRRSLQGT